MKNKAKWIKRQQEIVDAARAAGRGLTAEEQAEFDALQRQIEAEPDDQGGGEPVGGQDPANTPTPPHAGMPSATGEENTQRAVAEERQRINDILALCRQTGMDPAEHIRNGDTMDKVRAAAVDHMIQHGAPVQTGARDNGGDGFRAGAVDAVLMRAGVPLEHPAESADQFRGMSLRDLAIECMARDGEGSTASLLRTGCALYSSAASSFSSFWSEFLNIMLMPAPPALSPAYHPRYGSPGPPAARWHHHV